MDREKIAECLKESDKWVAGQEELFRLTNADLQTYLKPIETLVEALSPKAKIFMSILKVAIKLFASNAAQIIILMKKINELLKEELNMPSAPEPGGHNNGTPKN